MPAELNYKFIGNKKSNKNEQNFETNLSSCLWAWQKAKVLRKKHHSGASKIPRWRQPMWLSEIQNFLVDESEVGEKPPFIQRHKAKEILRYSKERPGWLKIHMHGPGSSSEVETWFLTCMRGWLAGPTEQGTIAVTELDLWSSCSRSRCAQTHSGLCLGTKWDSLYSRMYIKRAAAFSVLPWSFQSSSTVGCAKGFTWVSSSIVLCF